MLIFFRDHLLSQIHAIDVLRRAFLPGSDEEGERAEGGGKNGRLSACLTVEQDCSTVVTSACILMTSMGSCHTFVEECA